MKKIFCLLAALAVVSHMADARKVKGTVTSGEKFLEGVVVTDGANFASTNFKGQFTLEVGEDAEYVYIVTPAGYVADWSSGVPAFYQAADDRKKFDFDLQKTAGGFDYNIIAMSDPQFYSLEQFAKFAGKPLDDMTATAKLLSGITVGLTLGDIGWDESARLDDYKRSIVKTGVPFYPVVGNHDNNAWCKGDLESSAIYRSKMGPENYAFFLGKDVVIVLDNIIYDTNFKSQIGYADHVLAWVKGLMAYVPADADIYIAQHAPTMHGKRKIAQANDLLGLVRGHKVTFLSGHTHSNHVEFVYESNGNFFLDVNTSGSLTNNEFKDDDKHNNAYQIITVYPNEKVEAYVYRQMDGSRFYQDKNFGNNNGYFSKSFPKKEEVIEQADILAIKRRQDKEELFLQTIFPISTLRYYRGQFSNSNFENQFETNDKIEQIKQNLVDQSRKRLRFMALSGMGKTRIVFDVFNNRNDVYYSPTPDCKKQILYLVDEIKEGVLLFLQRLLFLNSFNFSSSEVNSTFVFLITSFPTSFVGSMPDL